MARTTPHARQADGANPDDAELRRLRSLLRERAERFERLAAEALAVRARAGADAATAARSSLDRADRDAAAALDRSKRSAADAWTRATGDVTASLEPLAGSPVLADWKDAAVWDGAPPVAVPPGVVRIGTATAGGASGNGTRTTVPVVAPALGRGHVVVTAPDARRDDAVGIVAATLLRLLAAAPPGHVRYRIFDPIGVGGTLSAFGKFDDDEISHGRPIAQPRDLDAALDALASHANTVSASYLRGDFASLDEFLDSAGPGFVPFEVFALLDAGSTFERDQRSGLERLASHAAGRGITFVVHQAASAPPLDLGADVTHITIDDRGTCRASNLPGLRMTPDGMPPSDLVGRVAARPIPDPLAIPFAETVQGAERFASSSAAGLAVPIGRSGLEPVTVELDDDTPHGLIAGDTGSGKSNLLRVVIYGLTRRYAPDELELYLLDFKEAAEFREFAPVGNEPSFLPHARVVSVNSSREFGVEVLEHVDRVTKRRYAELGDARKVEVLRERRPDEPWPRLLLIVDEFQRLFDASDDLSRRAAAALQNIAKQGRAAGVHFLMATQSIGDVGVNTAAGALLDGVFKNARLRVGMRLGESESRAIFSMANTAAAQIHQPGVAIVNRQLGAESANELTKVALIEDDVAKNERREAVSRAVGARRPPRVFDGDRGADPEANAELRGALRRRRSGEPADGSWKAWVGAELRVDDEDPRRQRGLPATLTPDVHRHLAIVGGGAWTAAAVLQWAAIGLAATSTKPIDLLLADLLRRDDVEEEHLPGGLVDATATVASSLGARTRVLRDRSAAVVLGEVRRLVDEPDDRLRVSVLFGADRLDGLEQPLDPDEDAFMPATPKTLLAESVARGARRGAHVLGWWSTVDEFDRAVETGGSYFGMRVHLRIPDRQLLVMGGGLEAAPEAPLAAWLDASRGDRPRIFQAYQPFGPDAIPKALR